MSSPSTPVTSLDDARRAVDRGDWHTAQEHLASVADEVAAEPQALELRGLAAYGAGELEDAVTAFEDLHALHRDREELVAAARAAATVAMYLMMDTGLMAPVRAWLARSDRLLDRAGRGEPRDVADADRVRALAAAVRTYERFLCGDPNAAGASAADAIRIGTDSDHPAAVALGRTAAARLAILDGDVDAGLVELEDVAATLLSGVLDPLTTGMVWCELICAVRGLELHDRAERWTAAMEQWRRDAAFGGINGRCRVHRAEMLRLRGACDEAEDQAERACDELAPWMRRELGWPLTELGTIRLRRGDLDGAETAFLAAHERAWDPQPGFALLRLAQGGLAAASAMIRHALERPSNVPFKERPPFGELRRAPLLAAQVEIAVAASDERTAERAAQDLQRIASTFGSPVLRASAGTASGRVALLRGETDRAVADLTAAVRTWADVGAPHDMAVARTLLGDARLESGEDETARLEWRSARGEFERLGDRLWHERLEARLEDGRGGFGMPAPQPGPAGASACGFTCDGDVRTITFDGDTVLLRDLKGMRYLARLLAEPGREFHALDLVAAEEGAVAREVAREDLDAVTRGGDLGPVLDEHARAAYRRRLAEVEQDIAEADRATDPERRALAEADREHLVAELSRAVGLGGRDRRTGSAAERARTSVTRTLRYSIERIAEHHEALGRHLDRTVETRTYCAYRPDPRIPVDWAVSV